MNLDFMKASEARALAEDCKVRVTDEHLTKMVDGINGRIAYIAKKGEFKYNIHVDDLFGMAGLNNLNKEDQKATVLTITNALRCAGYTVEPFSSYTLDRFLQIVVKW